MAKLLRNKNRSIYIYKDARSIFQRYVLKIASRCIIRVKVIFAETTSSLSARGLDVMNIYSRDFALRF